MAVSAQVYQQVSAQSQREELILAHLSLVRHILGRLAARFPRGIDLDNLEAAGVLGLVEAANRFEAERGIAFKTFAYTRIRGAIYDELRRNCPLPQDLLERTAKVRRILQATPPPASIDKLAKESGLSEEEVTECLAAMRLTRNVSWDDIAPFNKGQLASSGERPDELLEDVERKKLLVEAILQLPESERLSITLYYMEDLRLKEIGKVLNLSESRVSRLLKSAQHRIEEHIRAKEDDAA